MSSFERSSAVWLILLLGLLSGNRVDDSLTTKAANGPSLSGIQSTLNTLEEREEARTSLQASLASFLEQKEWVEAARTANQIGRLQLKLNAPSQALESFSQALTLLKTQPNVEAEIDSLNGEAAAYLVLKQKDKVSAALNRALTLSEETDSTTGTARALLTLSELQNFDDHVLALETAHRSLAIWKTLSDKNGLAATYAQIGRSLMAQGRLSEATENYLTARQLWRDVDDRSEQAETLIMMGFIEERKAEWQTAIELFSEAQTLIDERVEPRKMGQIAAGLADAFNENGSPEQGLTHYERSLAYYKLTGDPRSVRSATCGIALTYFLLKEFDEAAIRLEDVLLEIPPDSLDATLSYEYLGRIDLERGKYLQSLQYFQKTLPILIRAGNPMEAAQVEGLIGEVYQRQGKLALARRYYERALATFERLTDRVDQALMYYALGRLSLRTNKLIVAEEMLRRSITITESLRGNRPSNDLSAAFSASVHERYETYIECLMFLDKENPKQGYGEKAFEASEMARARSLAELLKTIQTKIVSGVDQDLIKQEKTLRQALNVKEDNRIVLLSRAYQRSDLEKLNDEIAALEASYRKLTQTIKDQYPAYEAIMEPSAWSLKQIQEKVLIDDETLLLEYALGEPHSYLYAVGRSEFLSFELPGRSQIEESTIRFQKLLTSWEPRNGETFEQRKLRIEQANQEFDRVTASFSDLLLGPVMAQLGARRLLIVADGMLHRIPFQALTVAKDQGTRVPLILDHEIVNEPSASVLGLVLDDSSSRSTPSRSVAIFANPVFEPDDPRVARTKSPALPIPVATHAANAIDTFRDAGSDNGAHIPALPASGEEARSIVSVVPWRSSFSAVGFDASRDTLMETNLGNFRVVHFATHGRVNYEHPEFSGLLLSLVGRDGRPKEGFLGLHDIYNLSLPVDLVVLSACNTGRGKEMRGEGLIGLTRGFLYAGARGVAASLWKVDDDATAELMTRFYHGMFSLGLSPAAALRKAQIEMWQQQRWHSPYYWAAFVLQGQYDQKFVPAKSSTRLWIPITVCSVLSLLSISFLFFKRRRKARL